MTYSSARFDADGDDTLERDAQWRKIDTLLDATGVGLGTRLLEIGTGWGALAVRAAQRGATVTTLTLSEEQAAWARERARRAGVSGRGRRAAARLPRRRRLVTTRSSASR